MSKRNGIGYQDHITGARYFRDTYYYAIVGDEERGYAFALFFGMIRIGNINQVDTLDELMTRLDNDCNILWHDYSSLENKDHV